MRASETTVFYEYLKEHTATCSMVAEATGIKQKNLCRYKKTLQDENLLWEVDFRKCTLTGFKAEWLTTNPELIPTVNNQLSLFDGGYNE
jgi:hypothetical protein